MKNSTLFFVLAVLLCPVRAEAVIVGANESGGFGGIRVVPSYTRHLQVDAMLSGTPANQPTQTTVQSVGCLQFPAGADKYAYFQFEIGEEWDGATDYTVEVDWFADAGSMSGTDTIQWILKYRCVAVGEAVNNGVQASVTVTNSDDNVQYITVHTPFTITYNHANQPLTHEDHCFFEIYRNASVSNDYAGNSVRDGPRPWSPSFQSG